MSDVDADEFEYEVPPLPPGKPGDPDGPLDIRRRDASSTGDIGQTFDTGEGRIFPCEQCGADLQFNIGDQKLTCQFCGFERMIKLRDDAATSEQDYHAMLDKLREWRQEAAKGQRDADEQAAGGDNAHNELRCESCGGTVEFIGTLTSTHCPYCGSPVQLEHIHKSPNQRIPVDGVLPFQIEKKHAQRNLVQWVNSRWFAPNAFRRRGVDGEFNGVYLSYFTFDSMTHTAYSGQRGEYYYVTRGSGKNKRRERRTRWYPASGRFERFFDDVLVLANTGLNRDFMLKLEPWPLLKVVPFNQQMLAGHMARTYDVELDDCFGESKGRMEAAIAGEVRQRIGGDTQRVHSIDSQFNAITYKHLLLPVWLLAYQYKEKSYQVFINAASGEVQGERPYSVWKILFAVLTAVAVVGAIVAFSQ